MYPLFESLCVKNGRVLHGEWHQLRFQKAYQNFFGRQPTFNLLDPIDLPQIFCHGMVKLKISYNETGRQLDFQHYHMQQIQSVRLVPTNDLDYTNKYTERKKLDALFALREGCDDVLIIRNGWITDSYYANVVFFDGKDWWTPELPLLEGTCRARLLANGIIKTIPLQVEDLKNFLGIKLINAMRDMSQPMITIEALVY